MSKFDFNDIDVIPQYAGYDLLYQNYLDKLADTINDKINRLNNTHIELRYDCYTDTVKIDFTGSAVDKHYANYLLCSLSNPTLTMCDVPLTDDNAGKVNMIFGGNYYFDNQRPVVYIPANPKMAVESARLLMFLCHTCSKAIVIHFTILHDRKNARNLPLNRHLARMCEISNAIKTTDLIMEEFKKAGVEYLSDNIKINLYTSIWNWDGSVNYCTLSTFKSTIQ